MSNLSASDLTGMLIFTGVLAIPFFIGAYYCARIFDSKRWPKTTGQIVRSELDRRLLGRRYGQDIYSYQVNLLYNYDVGGIRYQGSRVYVNNLPIGDKLTANLTMERYPEGKSVAVYYNPSRPGDAILEQSMAATVLLFMALDVMICVGIWVIALHPKTN